MESNSRVTEPHGHVSGVRFSVNVTALWQVYKDEKMTKSRGIVMAGCLWLASTPVFAEGLSSGENMTTESVVAIVNGVEVTLGHMQMIYSTLPEQVQNLPADRLWEGVLEQVIQQEVLAQSEEAQETFRVRLAVENERRSRLAAEVLAEVAENATSVGAIELEYKSIYEAGAETFEYRASHILVETEEQALEIIAELEAGADFAELAAEKSTGPSGPSGGDLGWFADGQMVTPFENAVKELDREGISAPVETQFGWHVIKLFETRVKAAPSLESVYNELAANVQSRAIDNFIQGKTESAHIERLFATDVDPSAVTQIEMLNQ